MNHRRKKSSWVPTKKWLTALLTGAVSIAVSAIESDGFDDAERGAAIVLGLSLITAYIKANDKTVSSDGVPHG